VTTRAHDVVLSTGDLAIDHELAQLSAGLRFLLEVTPLNAEEARADYAARSLEWPEFGYRELDTHPDVLRERLDRIEIDRVENATLQHLLRAKHHELELQVEMLRARDTEHFLGLSMELYGGVSPSLREQADGVLEALPVPESPGQVLGAEEFLALALEEIERYREQDADIEMHAEIRPDVSGVLVSGDTLLVSPGARIQQRRAHALIHHEVGTHLVTQVNGSAQPVKVLGTGLAGYDETQEGLAVLAEVACGGLTAFRLRQLAGRVLTVHRLVAGATFREAQQALVDQGFPESSAFTTTMRVYRAGGLTKDAIYLRGLVDLLAHVRDRGDVELLFLGKFSLRDLPLVADLAADGILRPARLSPRHLADHASRERLDRAANGPALHTILEGHP
jgi:uncharacterized protein (TIGR02421 family)